MYADLSAVTFRERAYAIFEPTVQWIPKDNHVVLDRFFQSWKYFETAELEIRKQFRFAEHIRRRAQVKLNSSLKTLNDCRGCRFDDVITIGVHVRRRNMAENQDLLRIGYKTADVAYLNRAMAHFDAAYEGKRHAFIVCSDDPDWCRKNLGQRPGGSVIVIEGNDPATDMAILSMCNDSIVTVGTFGWWSAWLAGGKTVYFQDWPRKGSSLAEATSHADYFPRNWIGM